MIIFKKLAINSIIKPNIKLKIDPNISDFLKKDKTHFILKGGRGSGKTVSIAKKLIFDSFDEKLSNTNFLCIRQFQNSITDSVKSELEKIINEDNLLDHFIINNQNIININTNIRFIFKGIDDFLGSTARQKALNRDKIKGLTNVTRVWAEEAQSLTENSLNVLLPTPRAKEPCQFYYTMNPTMACDPVIKKFLNREDACILHINITDLHKKYQNKELLKLMELDKNSLIFEHTWLGEPLTEVRGQPFLDIKESPILEDSLGKKIFAFLDPSFKGIDFTALAIGYNGKNFINIKGFCFANAWNNVILEIKAILKDSKVDYFYYESNCLGSIVQDVFQVENVCAIPIENTKNKIDRIYKIAPFSDSFLFKKGRDHNVFNNQVRYYESEISKNNSMEHDDAPDALASLMVAMHHVK